MTNLSEFLGPEIFTDVSKLITAQLSATHWANQHTGILAIGLIAQGCSSQIAPILPQTLSSILNFSNSSNPRLKWAALNSLDKFLVVYQSDIQILYHNIIIPSVLACLDDKNCYKVKAQASICIKNYTNGLLSDQNNLKLELLPYLPSVITGFLSIFGDSSSPNYLKSEVFDAISIIALAAENDFSGYFLQLIFGLRNIINDPYASKDLKCSAIKCVGSLVEAVTIDTFKDTVNTIMIDFFDLKNTLDDTDQIYQAIYDTLPQFAGALKERFVPYLAIIMPQILISANQNVDMILTDAESSQSLNLAADYKVIHFEMRGLGKKQLAISTSSLESKIRAVKVLYGLCEMLGDHFSDYVTRTVNVVIGLVNYKFNSDIRKFA